MKKVIEAKFNFRLPEGIKHIMTEAQEAFFNELMGTRDPIVIFDIFGMIGLMIRRNMNAEELHLEGTTAEGYHWVFDYQRDTS